MSGIKTTDKITISISIFALLVSFAALFYTIKRDIDLEREAQHQTYKRSYNLGKQFYITWVGYTQVKSGDSELKTILSNDIARLNALAEFMSLKVDFNKLLGNSELVTSYLSNPATHIAESIKSIYGADTSEAFWLAYWLEYLRLNGELAKNNEEKKADFIVKWPVFAKSLRTASRATGVTISVPDEIQTLDGALQEVTKYMRYVESEWEI